MRRLAFATTVPLLLVLLTFAAASAKKSSIAVKSWTVRAPPMGPYRSKMMGMHKDIKTAKDCTLGCVKAGATFVLYNATTKKTYKLDDQQKPMQFAGEKVKVTGSYDASTGTIHVVKIAAAS